jgi:NAD(P)-dependent dehydrogenase (short-subunit alcohol dehydrogenase family)
VSGGDQRAGRLSGKVVLITGAGTALAGVGNGRAIAILAAREGAQLCLNDLVPERAEETLAMIESEGGGGIVVGGDVTSDADCRRIVAAATDRFGRLDVLINCVGIPDDSASVVDVDEESWDRVIAVNLKSVVLMCKHAIPAMVAGGGGAIVNLSSLNGILAWGGSTYGASKAGLTQLTRDIAVDFGRQGIRANVIAIGHVWSPLASGGYEGYQGKSTSYWRERRRRIAPLPIEGTPWDVGWAAVYLASDEARFVNGVCLPVDGGATIVLPFRAAGFLDEEST